MATMSGALAVSSAHVTSGVPPPRRRGLRAVVRPARSLGHPDQCLGLDGFDGPAVLVGQPVHVEVQVDPRGGDRAVAGLGLDGFDGHPRLAQAGEAGVAQLVAGAVAETGPLPGGADDLVETRHRQRLAATRSFERDEERVGRRSRPVARGPCSAPPWRRRSARAAPGVRVRPCPR